MTYKDVVLFIADGDQDCTFDTEIKWSDVTPIKIPAHLNEFVGFVHNIKRVDQYIIGDVRITSDVNFDICKVCVMGLVKRGSALKQILLTAFELSLYNQDKRIKTLGEYNE